MNYAPSQDRRSSIRLTGAVYTPREVAASVVRLAMQALPKRRLRVLEPSAGDGAFLGQLSELMPAHDQVAVDIDEKVVESLRITTARWTNPPTLHAIDYIEFACKNLEVGSVRFDLIIGNPPFIRKHNFPDAHKLSLKRLSALSEYPLQDLKNSWAAFLVASANLVVDDGVVAFVLPYELITVSYGHAVLSAMLKIFERIDLFVSSEKAFPELDQDAIIFVGQRKSSTRHGLYVQRVQQISNLQVAVEHALVLDAARPLALDLNAFLIPANLMPQLRRLQTDLSKFSDFATQATGVVTAANAFFILKDADVERLDLRQYVLPILKKQKNVGSSPLFSAEDFEVRAQHEPCRLLHITDDLKDVSREARIYLESGVALGLPDRYKCKNRPRWYEVPLVKIAPGFFFKRSFSHPRMCINDAKVLITDTAYGIYPRPGFTMRGICFSFFNSLTMLFAETNGRFYGGGVLELSPSELKSLPMPYHEPSDEEFEAFLRVHTESVTGPDAILDFGDQWLKDHPAMAGIDLREVRAAWATVRSHRLRHNQRPQS